MTTIHAFNRSKTYIHTFPDVTLVFNPNQHGHVVSDVESESAVDRLLMVPTAFRAYHAEEVASPSAVAPVHVPMANFAASTAIADTIPKGESAENGPVGGNVTTPAPESDKPSGAEAPAGHDFVLHGPDGETFDLKPLDDAALREFCAANSIKVHHAAKGDTIRKAIVDALVPAAAPAA